MPARRKATLSATEQRPFLEAIDLSPASEKVYVWAAETAAQFGAPLVALHVAHDPASAPGYYERIRKRGKFLKRLEEAAAEMLSDFVHRMQKRHPELPTRPRQKLVAGLPTTRILEVAGALDAQMIVMGSRGHTGIKRLLLGSTAEKVAQLSPVPVTVVKASA